MSQEQLTFESNTTNKCIRDLKLAKRNVKIDTITRIAKALVVTVFDITKPIKYYYKLITISKPYLSLVSVISKVF